MYNWIQNYTKLEYLTEEEPYDFGFAAENRPRIHRLEPQPQPAIMSALAQYFIAASALLSENTYTSIPMRNRKAAERVLEEVSPHFAEARQHTGAGGESELVLQKLKPSSGELFRVTTTCVMPLIDDLYRHQDTGGWQNARKRTVVKYPVNVQALAPYEAEGIAELQALLRKLYFEPPGDDFGLMPLGWQFDDQLQHSVVLRFLAGFAPYLTLGVNEETLEVISIDLSTQEFTHPVLLYDEEPLPPRRNGNVLYLDLGSKLVYVIDLSKQGRLEHWADLHEEARVYLMPPEGAFADFDHRTARPIPAGVSLFYETDTITRMLETVNRELDTFKE